MAPGVQTSELMKKYSVFLLILLLNGSYCNENENSKVRNDVAFATTATTLDPVIEFVMNSLLQKEGETISKADVRQYLLLLNKVIKSYKEERMEMNQGLVAKIIEMNQGLVAKIMEMNQGLVAKIMEMNQGQEAKLSNTNAYLRDELSKLREKSGICFELAAYYSCAVGYRTNLEEAIETILEYPSATNAEDRPKIHKLIQEERNRRKKSLGELVTKLGELAKDYINVSENKLGIPTVTVLSEAIRSEEKPQGITPFTKNQLKTFNAPIPSIDLPKNEPDTSMVPLVSTTTANAATEVQTTTRKTPMVNTEKASTIKFKSISSIKNKFEHCVRDIIKLKIVGPENIDDPNFLTIELMWLSQYQEYNDEIWNRWKSKLSLWNEYYRSIWRGNASCAQPITLFSKSLRRKLFDEIGGLLSEWGIFQRGIRNYVVAYDKESWQAPLSDLESKCEWILHVEKRSFLHNVVEMLLLQFPKSKRDKWEKLRMNSINNESLYHEVCHHTSILFDKVNADILHYVPPLYLTTPLFCPVESKAFDLFLQTISMEDPYVNEISLMLKKIFTRRKKIYVVQSRLYKRSRQILWQIPWGGEWTATTEKTTKRKSKIKKRKTIKKKHEEK